MGGLFTSKINILLKSIYFSSLIGNSRSKKLRDSFAVMLFDWSRVWNFTSSPNVFYFISCLSHSS